MEVRITRKALKEIDKLPSAYAKKITKNLLDLESNPFPSNSKKLVGEKNYRIRIGIYRAIYTIDKGKKLVRVLRVKHRREVYRAE